MSKPTPRRPPALVYTVRLRTPPHPPLDLDADQLAGPVVALAEQNATELDLRNMCRRTGCEVTFRAVGWRVRYRDCVYRGVNYPLGKVVAMHFLRVTSVRVKEQP